METITEKNARAEIEAHKLQLQINEHQRSISKLQRKMVKVYTMINKRQSTPLSNLDSAVEMVKNISDEINITHKELKSKTRLQEVVAARQAIWYIFHKEYGMTFTSLAKMFDKNHATIIHGVRRVEDSLYLYQKFNSKTTTILFLEKICKVIGIKPQQLK